MPRKTFVAGEVLAAADVNTYLMDQAVMTFAGSAARGSAIASPSEGMVSYLEDTDSVEVYDSTNWIQVGGTQPGNVIQVVSTTKTDTFSTTSGTYTDVTDLSVSITPSSSSSKIMVLATVSLGMGSASSGFMQLVRDSTPIFIGDASGSDSQASGEWKARNNAAFANVDPNFVMVTNVGLSHLDSPGTTSAITYKVQLRAHAGTAYVNRSGATASLSFYGRFPSSITVMEIAG